MDDLIQWVNQCRLPDVDSQKRDNAMQCIYLTIAPDLHLFLTHRVHPSKIDDVLQEIWKAIDASIHSFKGSTDKQFLKWCYTIARNKAADSHRDRHDPWPEEQLWELVEASQEFEPLSQQDRLDLEGAMELLAKSKPECREILWSRFVLGFEILDLAKQLQLKIDATRRRIDRCLERARGLI